MKLLKNIAALLLVAVLAFSFTACHPKNEVAVTIGEYEFTSGYYMCALVFADMSARSKVDEELAKDKDYDANAKVDYIKQKVEKKDFSKWVKDTAIDNIKLVAAYKAACKDAKLELDAEKLSNAEYMAEYYWSSYGYSAIFGSNGVSLDTFKKYMVDSYYSDLYFQHVYGAKGEKAIADTDIVNTISSKYALANILDASFDDDIKDDEKTAIKDKFAAYETALKNGSRTFEDIYKEYKEVKDEEEKTEDSDTKDTDSKELEPLDKYASLIGNEDTNYSYEKFADIAALKVGEIKLITLEDNAGLLLVVKQDVTADPYYIENLDSEVRYILKGDEYEADMKKAAEKLDADINSYAVDRFKVKNIVYPETTA